MSYNPVNWVNGETPINDTNLNNMDKGIADAHEILADHDKKIDDFVKEQIPEEYVKGAVDDYISENQAGLASKEVVEEVAEEVGKLSSEIVENKSNFTDYVASEVNLLNVNDSDVAYGYYNTTNGAFTVHDSCLTSGFVPYNKESVYRFSLPTDWFNYLVTLWNENKEIIKVDLSSYIEKSNGYATFNPTNIENAEYVRFAIFDSSKDFSNDMVVKNMEFPSQYFPFGVMGYSENFKKEVVSICGKTEFDNKVMLFTGDSICYGSNWRPTTEDYSNTGWCKLFKEKYPNSNTFGYGVGGTTIAKRTDRTDSILERLDTMISEHPEADYIIIQGGVNDSYNIADIPIGTISSGYDAELNENTFAGALESIFKKSQKAWLGKKIGYIVTFKVPTAMGTNFRFEDYMAMAKQICDKWSIPYCDLFNESNLNYFIDEVSEAYGGGLHPNEQGYKIISPKIISWIESM